MPKLNTRLRPTKTALANCWAYRLRWTFMRSIDISATQCTLVFSCFAFLLAIEFFARFCCYLMPACGIFFERCRARLTELYPEKCSLEDLIGKQQIVSKTS